MIIALCGGIASGKSAVAAILKDMGAAVLSADEINAEITESTEYTAWLSDNLGDDYVIDGKPNKTMLREQISYDDEVRRKINEHLHPVIRAAIVERSANLIKSGAGAVFVEVPLLMTAGMSQDFDAIWYVKTNDEERVKRLVKRSGISEEAARKMLYIQDVEKNAEKIANVIIDNDNTYNILCQKVRKEYGAIIK